MMIEYCKNISDSPEITESGLIKIKIKIEDDITKKVTTVIDDLTIAFASDIFRLPIDCPTFFIMERSNPSGMIIPRMVTKDRINPIPPIVVGSVNKANTIQKTYPKT